MYSDLVEYSQCLTKKVLFVIWCYNLWSGTLTYWKRRKCRFDVAVPQQSPVSDPTCQVSDIWDSVFSRRHEIRVNMLVLQLIFPLRNKVSWERHIGCSGYTIILCHLFFPAKYQLLPYTDQRNRACSTESFTAIRIHISNNIRYSADFCCHFVERTRWKRSSVAWFIFVWGSLP